MLLGHLGRRGARLLDRATDTWFFQTLLGDPFTRPVELWFDASNTNPQAGKRRRVHVDANGNLLLPAPHRAQAGGADLR